MHFKNTLTRLHQEHLLTALDTASNSLKKTIMDSIEAVNWNDLDDALVDIHIEKIAPQNLLTPPVAQSPDESQAFSLLHKKPLGCVIMAGGQGSRLGYPGPKGIYPLQGTTLFEIHIEKLKALSKILQSPLYIGIMTSDATHNETYSYFKEKHWFGIESSIQLFKQQNMPLLTQNEKIILQEDGSFLVGPDGNGGLFEAMGKCGLLEMWDKNGIDFFSVILVDNICAEPFNMKMVVHHLLSDDEMTWAAVQRKSSEEKLGLYVLKDHKLTVLEYTEIDPSLTKALDASHKFLFPYANISQFLTRIETAKKLSKNKTSWHAAYKKAGDLDVIKLERFIFDHLASLQRVSIVEVDRENEFYPIKNREGEYSPNTALKVLEGMVKKTSINSLQYPNAGSALLSGSFHAFDWNTHYSGWKFPERKKIEGTTP